MSKIAPGRVGVPPADKDDHPVMRYMRATKHTGGTFSEKRVRAVRRTYYAMIAEADAVIGRLLRAVDELGLAGSTYIVFTGDHGDTNMQHQQTLKNSMYESSVRVPLIVTGPGVKEGVVVDDLVSLVDIFPTLMDMASLPKPEGLSGQSLMPLLTGKDADRRNWALSQYHSNMANTGAFMLRRGPWKYVAYAGYDPQLFNLEKDPDELRNVASDRPEVVQKMDAKLREIVDYETVDAAAKAYDRQHFRRWREQLGGDKACQRKLAGDDLYGRYSDEWRNDIHYAKIKSWLDKA
jgi:arylsulfatase K